MEREVLITGVGGQGVQLGAQVLARAAAIEGREVMLFGVYGGTMRGGNTDSTVVIGDAPIQAPPIVSRAWSAVLMSTKYWEPGERSMGMSRKLDPGGLALVNSSMASEAARPDTARFTVVELPATDIAAHAGRELTQTMVMIGAYVKVTQVVDIESLVEAMMQSLPDYRRQHAATNAEMLRVGYELDDLPRVPFWDVPAAATARGARR